MFVRKKNNKRGFTCVQITDKSSGKCALFQTVGNSYDSAEIDFLIFKGKKTIASHGGQVMLPFEKNKDLEFVDTFLQCLDSMNLVGPELLLGQIFDTIGFNSIEDEFFRHTF